MTILKEGRHCGEFLVSEANGDRSREVVTLASGNNLSAGAVLGVVTASGKYAEHDPDGSDGTQTAVAILLDNVDASAADLNAVIIARDAEVTASELTWQEGATAGNMADGLNDLEGVGIIAR